MNDMLDKTLLLTEEFNAEYESSIYSWQLVVYIGFETLNVKVETELYHVLFAGEIGSTQNVLLSIVS